MELGVTERLRRIAAVVTDWRVLLSALVAVAVAGWMARTAWSEKADRAELKAMVAPLVEHERRIDRIERTIERQGDLLQRYHEMDKRMAALNERVVTALEAYGGWTRGIARSVGARPMKGR